jgi:hypothetical protein
MLSFKYIMRSRKLITASQRWHHNFWIPNRIHCIIWNDFIIFSTIGWKSVNDSLCLFIILLANFFIDIPSDWRTIMLIPSGRLFGPLDWDLRNTTPLVRSFLSQSDGYCPFIPRSDFSYDNRLFFGFMILLFWNGMGKVLGGVFVGALLWCRFGVWEGSLTVVIDSFWGFGKEVSEERVGDCDVEVMDCDPTVECGNQAGGIMPVVSMTKKPCWKKVLLEATSLPSPLLVDDAAYQTMECAAEASIQL